MRVLAIDTSNDFLRMALVDAGEVVLEVSEPMKNNASEILMPQIAQLLNSRPFAVNLVAVSKGPGSYTGVRVGVTVAKTLAYAWDVPLVGVSSLELLPKSVHVEGIIVPTIDARRESVFAAAYDENGQLLIPEGHYMEAELLEKVGTFGTFTRVITPEVNPAVVLANLAVDRAPIEDIHSFSPEYLRKTEAENNLGGS